jgi:hypothetical protein
MHFMYDYALLYNSTTHYAIAQYAFYVLLCIVWINMYLWISWVMYTVMLRICVYCLDYGIVVNIFLYNLCCT